MKSTTGFVHLGIVVVINLVLQFTFQWYIITNLGAGVATDALFGAMALPQFILVVLSGSLTMVLIPLISRYTGDEFLSESWNYFQGIGAVFLGLALLLYATASNWVAWLLPGFKGADLVLALHLSRIQLIAMLFSALLSVVWAIHSAKGNFVKIETTSIAANLIALLLLVLLIKKGGIQMVAWISVARVALQVLFLMPILGSYRRPHFESVSFKDAWQRLRPLIAGNAYYKTDALADRYLTSNGASGELTLFNLAQQLFSVANSILSKVLINTMVPDLARAHGTGNTKDFNQLFKKRLFITGVISLLVMVLLLVVGKWGLKLVFAFKNFNPADINRLWWMMVLLGGCWIGGLLGGLTSSTFYAQGNTVTPTRIGAILFTLYLPMKVFCYFRFGVEGLAISISVYYLLSLGIQLIFLRRHLQ